MKSFVARITITHKHHTLVIVIFYLIAAAGICEITLRSLRQI